MTKADETRARILDAALSAFADHGYEGASTREIARRAGVTQPLVAYHYQSKDTLWRAAVDRIFHRYQAQMQERLGRESELEPTTLARLVVRHFVEFSAHNPELYRIMMQESTTPGARIDWLVETYLRPMYERATIVFEEMSAQGEMLALPPVHLWYLLTGAGASIYAMAPVCRRLAGVDPTEPRMIEAHVDAMMALLFQKGP